MFLSKLDLYQLSYKITFLVVVAVAALSIASIFGRHPFLELTTHFRLQYSLAALVCLVVFIAFHSWKLVPVALCCVLFNLAYLVPYYVRATQPEISSATLPLRIFHANLYKENENYEALIASVNDAQADVIVLQELTEQWAEQTRVLRERYAFIESAPRPGGSGMAILSRYPLEETRVLSLDASTHLAILARVNVDGTSVSILGLHPPTPVTPTKFANRNQQFQEAADLLKGIKGSKVLIGDLNTTPWSPYFNELVQRSEMRDARLGFGLKTSWPMPLPSPLRIPIDHCLVSDDVVVKDARIGKRTGSDHRPLIVDLEIPRIQSTVLSHLL